MANLPVSWRCCSPICRVATIQELQAVMAATVQYTGRPAAECGNAICSTRAGWGRWNALSCLVLSALSATVPTAPCTAVPTPSSTACFLPAFFLWCPLCSRLPCTQLLQGRAAAAVCTHRPTAQSGSAVWPASPDPTPLPSPVPQVTHPAGWVDPCPPCVHTSGWPLTRAQLLQKGVEATVCTLAPHSTACQAFGRWPPLYTPDLSSSPS